MSESGNKFSILRAYRIKQELQYVSKRAFLLMIMLWGMVVTAAGAWLICVYCAGLSQHTFDNLLLSGAAVLIFTGVTSFILGKEVAKTRVRRIR